MNLFAPLSPLPISRQAVVILSALYLLLGITHGVWRSDDAVHIAVAWDIATRHHWLNPELAGTQWDGAPLWHWFAASLGLTLGKLIGFHEAARLSSALFGALAFYAAARCTSTLSPSDGQRLFGRVTPLLLIGSLGLLIPIHEAQPVIAVLAGHALVYWGLARLPQQQRAGVFTLGKGLLITVFSGGLTAAVTLLPLLVFVLLAPEWRRLPKLLAMGLAILVVGALAAWPLHSGLLPRGSIDFAQPTQLHFELLAWFAWPTLPLAVWALWINRRQWRAPMFFLPLIGSLGSVALFLSQADLDATAAVPMLLPLALLATTAAGRLRRGAANAFDWFGMMGFSFATLLVWIGALAMLLGVPQRLHHNLLRHTPGFTPELQLLPWLLALTLTALWLFTLLRTPRSSWRGSVHWGAGVTLMWAMVVCLWMPWIEHRKNYAQIMQQLDAAVPSGACVLGRGLNEAQRAILDYQANIVTRRQGSDCDWLLIETSNRNHGLPPSSWEKVLEVARPGEKQERFYLYRRSPQKKDLGL